MQLRDFIPKILSLHHENFNLRTCEKLPLLSIIALKEGKLVDNGAQEQKIELEFVVEKNDDIQEIYANFINISHTPWDFTFMFCCATMPIDQDMKKLRGRKKLQVKAPCVAKVKIPAISIDSLIDALQKQKTKYQENMELNQ